VENKKKGGTLGTTIIFKLLIWFWEEKKFQYQVLHISSSWEEKKFQYQVLHISSSWEEKI
jgi:hypothetical protein